MKKIEVENAIKEWIKDEEPPKSEIYLIKHLFYLSEINNWNLGYEKRDGKWYILGLKWKEKAIKEFGLKREEKEK